MGAGNELTELYDCLSVLYGALPADTQPDWKRALKSILYGDELLAEPVAPYGKQQNERNRGKRKDYARRHENGDRVTEFTAIAVQKPRPEDQRYVPSGAMLPVAPDSEEVLPVMVSDEAIDRAITLLAEFPAEPAADRLGDGVDVLLNLGRVRREKMGRGTDAHESTVLFVSDTHLGYENRAITGRGKTVPWIDEISRVEIAVELDVDAIIHTGDVLDHEVDADTLAARHSDSNC